MTVNVPSGFICRSFSIRGDLTGMEFAGLLKKIKIINAETAPMGRLI
jgi:hypothetical protein